MVVQHNIPAFNTSRQFGINNTLISKNLEKLSSGYKINRAADDAAGLAISEKMRGQIRGAMMGTQNVNMGINLIQTAEGGLDEVHSILQRMRELAVQSSNGTYDDGVDRKGMNEEYQSLMEEINRIAESTHYNGISLLNVPEDVVVKPPVTPPSGGGNIGSGIITTSDITPLNPSITVTQTPGGATATVNGVPNTPVDEWKITGGTVGISPSTTQVALIDTNSADLSIYVSDYTPPRSHGDWPDLDIVLINNDTGAEIIYGYDGQLSSGGTANIPGGGTISYSGISGNPEQFNIEGLPVNYSIRVYIRNGGTPYEHQFTIDVITPAMDFGGGSNPTTEPPTRPTNTQRNLWIQGGANNEEGMYIELCDSRPPALGIDGTAVNPLEKANQAITFLDDATNLVSSYRASFGASQNRLDSMVRNNGVKIENLQAAEASIRDLDMAKEMMEFTKNNILVQASQAMLSQANQLPQGVLSLLH